MISLLKGAWKTPPAHAINITRLTALRRRPALLAHSFLLCDLTLRPDLTASICSVHPDGRALISFEHARRHTRRL
jgi:hypothetical protein